jgi:hypothetical protein
MNNVKIEITKKGWDITVNLNGEIYTEKYIATSTGAKCIEGNFDNVDMDDDLRESLQIFAYYDIMLALAKR